jgi:hypothetical protein
MVGTAQDAAVLVIVELMVVQLVVATVLLEQLKTVMVLVSVLLNHGSVMAYVMETVKSGVQTFAATIMMAVTVLMLSVQTVQILVR